jgi:hypothetical protein
MRKRARHRESTVSPPVVQVRRKTIMMIFWSMDCEANTVVQSMAMPSVYCFQARTAMNE